MIESFREIVSAFDSFLGVAGDSLLSSTPANNRRCKRCVLGDTASLVPVLVRCRTVPELIDTESSLSVDSTKLSLL